VDDDTPDVTTVTMTVTGANDAGIELPLQLDPDFGTIVQTGTEENGVYTFDYTKPAGDLPSGIATVTATSIAQTGIRADINDPPLRTANLLISPLAQRFDVTPGSACLGAGDTQQFQALNPVTGEPVEVSWSADRGSINASGLYTAPAGDGSDAITASTETNASSVQVTIGDCTCYFKAELSGAGVSANVVRAGLSYLALGRDDTTHNQLRFFGQETSPDNTTGIILELDPPLLIGASGSLSTTTRSSGFVGGERYVLFGPDGPLPALTVDITRRTPIATGVTGSVALEGRVYGSVNVARNEAPPDNLVPAYLNVEFNGIYTIPTAGPALNCDPDR